jgi:hypothetical protein
VQHRELARALVDICFSGLEVELDVAASPSFSQDVTLQHSLVILENHKQEPGKTGSAQGHLKRCPAEAKAGFELENIFCCRK